MLDGIAFTGIVLSWLAMCWLPFMVIRAVLGEGAVRKWSVVALGLTALAFVGYMRAIAVGTAPQAIFWSLFWFAPLGLAAYVWRRLDPPLARFDKWLAVGALFFFVIALPALPQNLHWLSGALF
ncbi:MAG: hypothetical protein HKN63_09915 [Rhodobacteraceae bacterium]|nr:hypothetical protein [Paracoccaceae bacterium]